MDNTLLGLPVEVWAIVCFAAAGAYARLWPRPPRTAPAPRTVWQQFVLRWMHTITWVCLGAAALALKYVGITTAQILGLLGLVGYITFMTVFLREKLRYPNG